MGRWTAVSDWDYDDELNPWQRDRTPRCPHCGAPMTIVYNGDGQPVSAKCDECSEKAR